jgi:PAS domain S-box-containing protein
MTIIAIVVLALSMALQAGAGVMALSLIRPTGEKLAWGMLAAALFLMAVRPAMVLFDIAFLGELELFDADAELVALATSIVMVAGIAAIRPFFRSLRRKQEVLEESQTALADAQRIAKVGSWEWDLGTDEMSWSDEYYRLYGYEPGQIAPTYAAFLDRVHPDDREIVQRKAETARRERRPHDFEFRVLMPDGTVRFLHCQGSVIFDDRGTAIRLRGTVQDITERKRAETLAIRFGRIIEESTNEVYIFDSRTLKYIQVNRRARENLGYSDEELRNLTPTDLKPYLSPSECEEILRPLCDGGKKELVFEGTHRRKDGTHYKVEVRLQLSHAETPPVFVALVEDITERKRIAAELSKTEELFHALIEYTPNIICLISADATIRYISPSVERVLGYKPEKIVGTKTYEIVHPNDIPLLKEALQRVLRAPNNTERVEVRVRHADGSWHVLEFLYRNLLDNPAVNCIIVNAHDITDRIMMEQQLRQAHKMEAVGQLTGGIAHDFNNLLAVIIGNLDVLEERVRGDPEFRALVRPAAKAAERGALLTERLLAFSRKQALRPSVVDLNELVIDMSDLLRRTLGEIIAIENVRGANLWLCEVDPAQLENAILNLALNARDAMPDGGKLTIETTNGRLDDDYAAAHANVVPGHYVVLAVSDTGTGMPPEVLKCAFEPFFTTKEVGQGTGLGLSMVYGFIKQSGGHVTIYSEVGHGTTVRLYLPRARLGKTAARPCIAAKTDYQARGETVLVVEDDADVRSLAVILLGDLGYAVLEAGNGKSALELLAENSRINLILTDMVMPGGLNGRALAREAQRISPGIPVVFMSGYTEKAAARDGKIGAGEIMIQKPFRRMELARKLRQALDPEHTL